VKIVISQVTPRNKSTDPSIDSTQLIHDDRKSSSPCLSVVMSIYGSRLRRLQSQWRSALAGSRATSGTDAACGGHWGLREIRWPPERLGIARYVLLRTIAV